MAVPGKATPINSRGIRYMTPEEWGKLQGFVNYAFLDESGNDAFSFLEEIPETQKYKLLGNAVSIPVISCMAEYMYDCLKFLDSTCDGKSLDDSKISRECLLQESIRNSRFEALFYAENDGKRTRLINIKGSRKRKEKAGKWQRRVWKREQQKQRS